MWCVVHVCGVLCGVQCVVHSAGGGSGAVRGVVRGARCDGAWSTIGRYVMLGVW